MKNWTHLTIALAVSFAAAVLSGCTTIGTIPEVEIKDHVFYADAGSFGATWRTTLSDRQGHLSKKDWDELRKGMICTTSDSIEHDAAVIEKFCYYTGRCTYEEVQSFLGPTLDVVRDVKFRALELMRKQASQSEGP